MLLVIYECLFVACYTSGALYASALSSTNATNDTVWAKSQCRSVLPIVGTVRVDNSTSMIDVARAEASGRGGWSPLWLLSAPLLAVAYTVTGQYTCRRKFSAYVLQFMSIAVLRRSHSYMVLRTLYEQRWRSTHTRSKHQYMR